MVHGNLRLALSKRNVLDLIFKIKMHSWVVIAFHDAQIYTVLCSQGQFMLSVPDHLKGPPLKLAINGLAI